jgi:hypothetical protein
MPELTDEEMQALQGAKEEGERTKAELARVTKAYQDDIAQVTQYVTNMTQQQTQANQQQMQAGQGQSGTEEDELFVQHPNLQRRINETVVQTLRPVVTSYIKDTLETNLRLSGADPEVHALGKYRKEVEQLLRQGVAYDPRLASPESIKNAFKLVASQHIDEIVQERMQQRADNPDDDDDVSETGTEHVVRRRGPDESSTSPGRPSPPVSLNRGSARAEPVLPGKRVHLAWGEKNMAKMFDMTPEEYVKHKNKDHEEDVFGFKGRRRI